MKKTIRLASPIKKDDKVIDTIVLDLDKITGEDLIKAELEARAKEPGIPHSINANSAMIHACVASKASGLLVDDILRLSGPDFMRVTTEISNFLFGWVLTEVDSAKSE